MAIFAAKRLTSR